MLGREPQTSGSKSKAAGKGRIGNQVGVHGFPSLSNRAIPLVYYVLSFRMDFYSSILIEPHHTDHTASLLFTTPPDCELHFKVTFNRTTKLHSWQVAVACYNLSPFPVPQTSIFNTHQWFCSVELTDGLCLDQLSLDFRFFGMSHTNCVSSFSTNIFTIVALWCISAHVHTGLWTSCGWELSAPCDIQCAPRIVEDTSTRSLAPLFLLYFTNFSIPLGEALCISCLSFHFSHSSFSLSLVFLSA